jgi:predicted transcriptional regulator
LEEGLILFNKRRNEIEIIQKILHISKEGAKKTEILYKNNMSFTQLNNYLNFLLENEILEAESQCNDQGTQKNIFYLTTDKGKNLLNEINSIMDYFK